MGARSPTFLPYGLSSEYKAFITGEKDTPNQSGPLSFRIASLRELSTPSRPRTWTLPHPAASSTASAPDRSFRIAKPKKRHAGAQRNLRDIQMALKIIKKKCRRLKKRHKLTTFRHDSVSERQTEDAVDARVNLRLGASHGMPITLNSDSGESVMTCSSDAWMSHARGTTKRHARPSNSVPQLGNSRHQSQTRSARTRPRSRSGTPLQDTYASSDFALPSSPTESSSSESDVTLVHEPIVRRRTPRKSPSSTVENGPRMGNTSDRHVTDRDGFVPPRHKNQPTIMRDVKSSGLFSRIKSKTPGPGYRFPQPPSQDRTAFTNTSSNTATLTSETPDKNRNTTSGVGKDMALVDIDDFDLRNKVAQLMAVAPALPVRDLYHLVIDCKGRVHKAKKMAIRMSEAPRTPPFTKQPTVSRPRPIVGVSDAEEVMVKVDPNDPTFEWDEDEPVPEPTSTVKARPPKSNRKNKTSDYDRSRLSTSVTKRSRKTKPSSRSSAKHFKESASKRTSTRETSSDRDFIVADNVIEYVLDLEEDYEPNYMCENPRKKTVIRRRKYSMR